MAINTEKVLRKLPAEEKIFRSTKRVSVVRAADCVVALSKSGMDAQTIKTEIGKLLDDYKIVRVQLNDKNKDSVDLAISKTVNASDYYMWTEDQYDYKALAMGLLGVALALTLAMYKIWPMWLKVLGKYAQYGIIILLITILLLSVIRIIIFVVTHLTCSSGLWIFPNLFAECGFIESFIPGYAWNEEDSKSKTE